MINDDSEISEKRYTLRPTSTPLPSKAGTKPTRGLASTSAESQSANVLESECNLGSTDEKKAMGSPEPSPATCSSRKFKAAEPSKTAPSTLIRAANEDDDLYDPYSDYHDGTLKAAEFEEDPWR